jgi:A/G-specific adenine glycosylase
MLTVDDSAIRRRLLGWYARHRRDLPWRASSGTPSHPYYTLLSEFMLQQTQVSTVVPYFERFVGQFARLQNLAEASEQEVLRLWQGLGYYSRARNLLAAARQIVGEHGGIVPSDVPTLLGLPGIGRYTAGAIASLAYDTRAPIVDGNVARVLARLGGIQKPVQRRAVQQFLWRRAEELLPRKRCGDFNSALMELGAMICTPRAPRCGQCPLQRLCTAHAQGLEHQIPPPRIRQRSPLALRRTFCLAHRAGPSRRWLIEQRPHKGRWAGMWQFVTVEADESPVTPATIRAVANLKSSRPRVIGRIEHTLTHRRYHFDVYLCDVSGPVKSSKNGDARRWVRLDQLKRYPLPRPHLRIAGLLQTILESGGPETRVAGKA